MYGGRTWEQRLSQRSDMRQLVPTSNMMEDRAWAKEDDVFAEISGRRKRKRRAAAAASHAEEGCCGDDDMSIARQVYPLAKTVK